MNTTEYQRARSPEHKAERFAEIMQATDRLFQTRGFHEITLTTIAKELGWSRGNLYKYVQTKEEIFLAIYNEKNGAFVADMVGVIGDALPLPTEEFARRWAEVTDRHHDYLRYQHILTSVIETNVPLERLTEFKSGLLEDVMPIVELVGRQCPGISINTAANLYLAFVYESAGLEGHLCGSPLQMEAMRRAGMPLPEGGFERILRDFVAMCLRGVRPE